MRHENFVESGLSVIYMQYLTLFLLWTQPAFKVSGRTPQNQTRILQKSNANSFMLIINYS